MPSAPTDVRVGAVVKAVYVEMWYMGSGTQPVFQVSTLEKLSGGAPFMEFTDANTLNAYPNKKNILYLTQGLVGDANSNPIPIFRGWFKIPKGKQRIGIGDQIVFNVNAFGEADQDIEVCGQFTYKEYF